MTKKERAAEYMAMIVAGMDATEALLQFGKECWDEAVDISVQWMETDIHDVYLKKQFDENT